MPTTVSKTIGATSSPVVPDFTSLASWIAGCPANLVTADEIWEGQCLNQGEFVSASTLLTLSGITTDSTRYTRLTTAVGASFRDNAGVRTNALSYNSSNGVAIRCTGAYADAIVVSIPNCQFVGLQISSLDNTFFAQSDGLLIDGCIIVSTSAFDETINAASVFLTIYNSLILGVNKSSSPLLMGRDGSTGSTVLGTTVISKSGVSPITADAYADHVIVDCALFGGGSATKAVSAGSATFGSCSNNATDSATAVGSANQTSLTFASQFISTTADFRAEIGGSLPNNGTPNSNILVDITGTTRSATTPTIGCWEVTSSGGGSFTVTLDSCAISSADSLALQAAASIALAPATILSAGSLAIAGASAIALDAATLTSAGLLAIQAAASLTLDSCTLVSTGTPVGIAAITLGPATLTSAGDLVIQAAATVGLEAATLASAGRLLVQAAVSVELAPVSLTSAGQLVVQGLATVLLGDATLVSDGTLTNSGIGGNATIQLATAMLAAAGALLIQAVASVLLEPVTLISAGDLPSPPIGPGDWSPSPTSPGTWGQSPNQGPGWSVTPSGAGSW